MSLVKQNISYRYCIIRLSYPSSQNSNNYTLKSCTSGGRYPFQVIAAFGHYIMLWLEECVGVEARKICRLEWFQFEQVGLTQILYYIKERINQGSKAFVSFTLYSSSEHTYEHWHKSRRRHSSSYYSKASASRCFSVTWCS